LQQPDQAQYPNKFLGVARKSMQQRTESFVRSVRMDCQLRSANQWGDDTKERPFWTTSMDHLRYIVEE
jgi:hypothetical protein